MRMTPVDMEWPRWHYGEHAFPSVARQENALMAMYRFRHLRVYSGLRPVQLARRLGVDRATVSRIESAARKDIGVWAMERYANACGFEMIVEFRAVTEKREWIRE